MPDLLKLVRNVFLFHAKDNLPFLVLIIIPLFFFGAVLQSLFAVLGKELDVSGPMHRCWPRLGSCVGDPLEPAVGLAGVIRSQDQRFRSIGPILSLTRYFTMNGVNEEGEE